MAKGMAIPYRTAKFKSAIISYCSDLGSTAKFNYRQYFRLIADGGYSIHSQLRLSLRQAWLISDALSVRRIFSLD